MKTSLYLFLGAQTCSPDTLLWSPGAGTPDTADTADTSDTGGDCDPTEPDTCASLDMVGNVYAFEGTIPGTEDAEAADCGGTCYRCVGLRDGFARVYFFVEEPRKYDMVTFNYLENSTGSYTVDLLYTWTAVAADGPLTDVIGYLVVEPKTGEASVVGLSACSELE